MPCTLHASDCGRHTHNLQSWRKTRNYERFAMVWDNNGLFVALEDSGPCYGGPQSTDNRDYWANIADGGIVLSDALDGYRTTADNVGASEWALAQVNAKAETADNKADNAQHAADAAQETANVADNKADTAQREAENAQNTAQTADAKADAALEAVAAFSRYELCEFYTFRGPELPAGFYPRTGGVIANCASLHPEAWRKLLDTPEGRAMCLSEEAWQAMNKGTFATLADGSKVGWNGIGGVPFYAPDPATGALRLPDTRGMYAEDAGFDALGVGGTHGDAIRNITGILNVCVDQAGNPIAGGARGALYTGTFGGAGGIVQTVSVTTASQTFLESSRVVPTAAKNQPRAWGALACVYLGAPR